MNLSEYASALLALDPNDEAASEAAFDFWWERGYTPEAVGAEIRRRGVSRSWLYKRLGIVFPFGGSEAE
jgi:hypothetical protein